MHRMTRSWTRVLCVCVWGVLLSATPSQADIVVDFDDLVLGPESFWNGPDPNGTIVSGPFGDVVEGSFTSRGARFVNRYDLTFGSWSGFAYSNKTDTTTGNFTNQFSAITGSGRGVGNDNYGVGFGYDDIKANLIDADPFDPNDPADLFALPYFTLPAGATIEGMYVTNTTYAALTMLNGDAFSKKFGGTSGNDPDYFLLSAYGTDDAGNPLGITVEFYLADYRFHDNSLDYVVMDWRWMDLSALSGARSIHFNLSSSDVGDFGMNNPALFAVDDIRYRSAVVPEPSSWMMVAGGIGMIGLLGRARRRVRR